MKAPIRFLLLSLCLSLLICCFSSCSSNKHKALSLNDLYEAFVAVPDSARTKVWWFHGETATTREGITADLEAFRQAGVGGVVYYDQVHGKAEGAAPVFSSDWWDALIFSAQEARRLGLTFEINLSNGYVAGGPWISPYHSMKRLCYSQISLSSGEQYQAILPAPSKDEFWDVKTLAFPLSSKQAWQQKDLITQRTRFQQATKLDFDLGEAFTARAITYNEYNPSKHPTLCMNVPGPPSDQFYGDGFQLYPPFGTLEASQDGVHYHVVCSLPTLYRLHYREKTIPFPAVTARYFRLNLHDWDIPDKQRSLDLRKVSLSSQAMMDTWQSRSGLQSEYLQPQQTPDYRSEEILHSDEMVDLTEYLQPDGYLSWTAPDDGRHWMILRVAQTSTKAKTKHGRPGQMGLECDKLSAEAACMQWNSFAQVVIDSLSALGLKPWGVVMDSHEVGSQNWTHHYADEFQHLHGYDIEAYLPVLLGFVVDSKEQSETLLLHHRQTLAHLVNKRYFAVLDSLAQQAGVHFTAQAMGNAQHMICDNIAAKAHVSRPQGEFWAKHQHACYDIKEASSAAHIYGKNIASAEAFTDAKYAQSLSYLKSLSDYAFAFHLNELVVCASAYQPYMNVVPGNTANGREYCLNRNNSLWPLSRGFWDYQARCAYMMRQGKAVVDLCVYLGSDLPVKILSHRLPRIPEGYDWDVCTDDALLHVLSCDNGRLRAANDMSYSVLVIERLAMLSPQAEAKIAALKASGLPVYDARVAGDDALQTFLDSLHLSPDVAFKSANLPEDRLMFAHRSLNTKSYTDNYQVYFFYNHSPQSFVQEVVLRQMAGKVAEYWNPCNGQSYRLQTADTAQVDLKLLLALAPGESGFVVLHQEPQSLPSRRYAEKILKKISLNEDWNVDFCLSYDTLSMLMPTLCDWRQLENDTMKYHSGKAWYHKEIWLPSDDASNRIFLRINGLEAAALVWLNGRPVDYVWCSPWEVELTDFVQEGQNLLQIEVVNQLTNRMIGDLSLPEDQRSTFATTPIVHLGDTLLPAGITHSLELLVR